MIKEKGLINKGNIKILVLLQFVVMIYTLSGVAAKFASGHKFMSLPFIFFYGLEIFILGVYAILWQQIIKRIDLSVAYINRSVALLWSMLWAVLFFKEGISIKNILGVIIVAIGTIIINTEKHE